MRYVIKCWTFTMKHVLEIMYIICINTFEYVMVSDQTLNIEQGSNKTDTVEQDETVTTKSILECFSFQCRFEGMFGNIKCKVYAQVRVCTSYSYRN